MRILRRVTVETINNGQGEGKAEAKAIYFRFGFACTKAFGRVVRGVVWTFDARAEALAYLKAKAKGKGTAAATAR